MKLPTGDELRAIAIHFLNEGDEHDAAKILLGCTIEIGEICTIRGSTNEINITLRCGRKTLEKLMPVGVWQEETALMKRLKNAICASLPSGYGVANLEARASLQPVKPAVATETREPSPVEQLSYASFTQPDSLAKVGRELLKELIEPFGIELAKNGTPLPAAELKDQEYFPALSKLLRLEDRLPRALREKIEKMLEGARLIAAAYRDESNKANAEFDKNHSILRLLHRESGRGLLGSLSGTHGMIQDYPERLSSEQAEAVGWVLDFLRDFIDVGDDIEPGVLLKYEQEVFAKLDELKTLGLCVFTGNCKSKQVFENGQSFWSPVTIVLVAATNDPRIVNGDGPSYINGAIRKNIKVDEAPQTNQKTKQTAEGNTGKRQTVDANIEKVIAELRDFQTAMADIVRQKVQEPGAKPLAARKSCDSIEINGRPEKLYHVCLLPLKLTLSAQTIDIKFKSSKFGLLEQKEVLAPLFAAGNAKLNGLKEHPSIQERGIGSELASMLRGTLEFPQREELEVFCRVRANTPEENDFVFQERMRVGDGESFKNSVPTDPLAETGFILIGNRFSHTPEFNVVRIGGKVYDLSARALARYCVKYLADNKAFDGLSARHFEDEIDPYVRQQSMLPNAAECKIHHYFAGDKKLAGFRKEFIKAAGKNGRYFLDIS